MVVTGEVGDVTGNAFTSTSHSWSFQGAISRRIVAGGAALYGMNLAGADKG